MSNKLTKKDYLEILKGLAVNAGEAEAANFCDKEIEKLENRKTVKTQKQKDNEVYVEAIYKILEELGKPATIAEIQAASANEDIANFNGQKMSALLKKLYDAKRITKAKTRADGKLVTLFSIGEINLDEDED